MRPRRSALAWIGPDDRLPPASDALAEPNGLVAAGEDLSAQRLIEAYSGGIFPWFSAGQPVLWWSPDPRMVLRLSDFKVSRSLAKTVRGLWRAPRWHVTIDRAFIEVMHACAAPRDGSGGTWITRPMIHAYSALHQAGHAHSVEIWEDRALIGGLYGVALGRMFYGESMFARRTDASKVALYSLVEMLKPLGFRVIDCQQNTGHLASLGAAEVPRSDFLAELGDLISQPPPDWRAVEIGFPKA